MKNCTNCGVSLKDEDSFCSYCGATCGASASDSLQALCKNAAVSGKMTVSDIEKNIAKYYNNNLSANSSGKYVVLHHETSVSGNTCKVIVKYQADNSNSYISVADVSVNMVTGNCTIRSKPTKKIVSQTKAHVFMRIVAVIMMLNIIFIPFLCDKYWSITDEYADRHAWSFSDMIDDMNDGSPRHSELYIDFWYYFGGLACALLIFFSAIGKNSVLCMLGSLAGIGICIYLMYQVYSGTTIWYVGISEAQLSFGFYITCAGFASVLLASLYKNQE